MDVVLRRFDEKYARTEVGSLRRYSDSIDWDSRLICIRGARGVGKTTMLLQHLKKNYKTTQEILYTSLDHNYFLENKLYDLAEEFHQKGGRVLALDEVHRYPNWSVEIKNIYDDFPDLKVIFTGSSILQISKSKADLSRRAVVYNMPGLSFREYLQFETDLQLEPISFHDIILNHRQITMEMIGKFKPLQYFSKYLEHGYFPFYLESKTLFHQQLEETLNVVLDVDIPQYEQVQVSNIILIKKLLKIIAESVPFKPNYQAISQRSGLSINTIKKYIRFLSDAELILQLHQLKDGLSKMGKPDKIYVNNPNLMFALAEERRDIGNLRETFFFNQVKRAKQVHASPVSDFLVDGTYTFEIGGKHKKRKQINTLENAYIVKDDIESGYENVIPLWLFGMMY